MRILSSLATVVVGATVSLGVLAAPAAAAPDPGVTVWNPRPPAGVCLGYYVLAHVDVFDPLPDADHELLWATDVPGADPSTC